MDTCSGNYGSHAWVSQPQQVDFATVIAHSLTAVVTCSMAYSIAIAAMHMECIYYIVYISYNHCPTNITANPTYICTYLFHHVIDHE